jgi:hypothetical protein
MSPYTVTNPATLLHLPQDPPPVPLQTSDDPTSTD